MRPEIALPFLAEVRYESGMTKGNLALLYLDYNATAPVLPVARAAATEAMDIIGNPSSVHAAGRAAHAVLEQARAQVAALVGARPRDVVFTSGGTEANNAVLRAAGAERLIISAVEHDCIRAAAEAAQAAGVAVQTCPVDEMGRIRLDALDALLKEADGATLVSVMAANNETGVLQPVAEAAKLTRAAGARFHSDAVQAAGRMPLDITALDADYLSLSAHKIGGLKGVGAIVLRDTAPLSAFIAGGGQELGRRSGTENLPGIAAFGAAAVAALGTVSLQDKIRAKRDRLEALISAQAPEAEVIGGKADRLANTSCVRMPGVRGETQVMHFDLDGIAISSGAACSSGKVKASHVLEAMGYTQEDAGHSVRISLGAETTDADIDRAAGCWLRLHARRRQ